MRKSTVPEEERPVKDCKRWINSNTNFCWTSAAAWECSQLQVCGSCVIRNHTKELDRIAAIKAEQPKKPVIGRKLIRFKEATREMLKCIAQDCSGYVRSPRHGKFCVSCIKKAGRRALANSARN